MDELPPPAPMRPGGRLPPPVPEPLPPPSARPPLATAPASWAGPRTGSAPAPPPAGLVVDATGPGFAASLPHPTLPMSAALGAVVVLTASLIVAKLLVDWLVAFAWPIAVYVALLSLVGYGPSLVWCRYVSRRWGTGAMWRDLGARPRVEDIGWGPVVWLAAVGCQIVAGLVVQALGIPLSSNTEGIGELSADRTYVIAIVVAAVVAAPVVEELVFRGVVLRGLCSRLPAVAAIAGQGLLFGVAHADPVRGVGNIGLAIVLGAVGVALGTAAYLLRRLAASMIAHGILNAVVLAIVLSGVADTLRDQARI